MGRLCLHTGPQGSYYFFRDHILDHLRRDEEKSFLCILPVNRAVRYFKKQLVLDSQNKALQDPPIFTFRSLFQFIYQNLPDRKKIISQPMRLILLNQVLKEQRDQLFYFRPEWNFGRGLLLKTDLMLNEFFQFGFQAGDFSTPPLSAEKKYKDFGFLVQAVTKRYKSALIDESSLISVVVSQLTGKILNRLFPDLEHIYISGFGIYSPPMLHFIRFARMQVDIDLKIEFEAGNEHLFRHTVNAFDALSAIADRTIYHPQDRTGIAHCLFNPARPKTAGTRLKVPVNIIGATTRSDELRIIAQAVKDLTVKRHQPLHKIGITFPELDTYVPLIRKIFTEFEIPFNLSTGMSLAHSPLIQAYRQVLEIVNSGFRIEQVFKLALSPFLDSNLTREAHLVYRSALKCGLKFFSEGWEKRIEGLASKEVKEIIGETGGIPVTPEYLQEAIASVRTLCEKIKPLQWSRSAADFQNSYLGVLKVLGLSNWYSRENDALTITEQEKEFRAFNRFIKLLDQTVWMLKYLYGDQPIELQEFYQQLVLVIENETFNLREWSDYGVQIMPRLEILSLELDHLFIGGMVEGEFPRLFTRDIFFNDQERQEMGLNASEDRLGQDRFLFYQWLAFPCKQLVFSYPQVAGDKPLLPSTFFAALEEIDPEIKPIHPPPEEKLYSKKSFLETMTPMLKNELSGELIKTFQYWRRTADELKLERWEKGIRLLNEKRRHRKITACEGNLTGSARAGDWLNSVHIRKAFSVTALESYAFCPMQYFLQRILRLEEPEEPVNEINALEKGNLIHKILYIFYHDLSPVQRETPWLFSEQLVHTAEKILNALPYDDIQWHIEKEKYFGRTGQPGLFHCFMENEKESIGQSGFIPSYFELRFGSRRTGDYFRIKSESGDVFLYGIIDRIDVHADGRLMVIDYKTGSGFKNVNLTQIYQGSSLQIPVYLAAAGHFFKKKGAVLKPVAGAYYQVKDSDNCRQLIVMADSEQAPPLPVEKKAALPQVMGDQGEEKISFLMMITQSLNYITEYVNKIGKGDFRHTKHPLDERCKSYCAYSKICRKDPAKMLAMAGQEND